jgi:molybdopterin-guanine dinucleotide biosynthesis protein B
MVLTIIDIAGLKKSGKTTVIENLVKELNARGFKAGTLKKIHIPGFTIDQKGKDTFRHKKAGARFVISLAPEEIAIIKPHYGSRTLSDIIDLIPNETDFLICEELNESSDEILYIITLENMDKLKETFHKRSIGKKIIAISGIISNSVITHERFPIINTTTEKGIKELVDLILNEI